MVFCFFHCRLQRRLFLIGGCLISDFSWNKGCQYRLFSRAAEIGLTVANRARKPEASSRASPANETQAGRENFPLAAVFLAAKPPERTLLKTRTPPQPFLLQQTNGAGAA